MFKKNIYYLKFIQKIVVFCNYFYYNNIILNNKKKKRKDLIYVN